MRFRQLPSWKKAPFIRYIIPLSAGIVLQWNYHFPIALLITIASCCMVFTILFNTHNISARFRYNYLGGICITMLFLLAGCIIVFRIDVRSREDWIGHHLNRNASYAVRVETPLSEKAKSYKTVVNIEKVIFKGHISNASGRLILYLKKDSNALAIRQGSHLVIHADLKPVSDFENSTGFSYTQYCALQNIYQQAYLRPDQYLLLPGNNSNALDNLLLLLKEQTLGTLRKYIKGARERGLAAALLIGYKEELDKELTQSYSNTGVVHIIAISGLHIGIIYAILLLFLKPFDRFRVFMWAKPVILILCLWLFSLLTGGSPSVLRSAVMFSGIIVGKSINKRSNIYNNLAASAFLLLCYNPLWLYDTGFQLSYLAVLSLVVFMNRICHVICIRNKLLSILWNLAAVTLAAQILTIPICLYYFRQFPNMFLITNMITVPLSSLILVTEILLCISSVYSPLATITGQILEWQIKLMNDFVIYMETMPFALTKNVGISVYQVIILYIMIIIASKWPTYE